MKWKFKKQVTNGEVVSIMIIIWLSGFTIAYLHWGAGLPWF